MARNVVGMNAIAVKINHCNGRAKDFFRGVGGEDGLAEGGVTEGAGDVVLGEEDGVHPLGFGELGFGDGRVDGLVVGGVAGFVEEEGSEARGGFLGRERVGGVRE